MAITTVLFDLDGTLLPMDQDVFVERYFGLLALKLAPYGYESKALIKAIWTGTGAMVKNTGEASNETVFWKTFSAQFDRDVMPDLPLFEEYYKNEFQAVQQVCGYTPDAAKVVELVKSKGMQAVLATNPIFPAVATESRMRWAGLNAEDFELYTTYENARHSKPNPQYYLDILQQIGAAPQECLMVGNDVTEDMVAQDLGMQVFLLTDCLINKENKDISVYPHGDFDALMRFIDAL